jgi:hypothetical protein
MDAVVAAETEWRKLHTEIEHIHNIRIHVGDALALRAVSARLTNALVRLDDFQMYTVDAIIAADASDPDDVRRRRRALHESIRDARRRVAHALDACTH